MCDTLGLMPQDKMDKKKKGRRSFFGNIVGKTTKGSNSRGLVFQYTSEFLDSQVH